MTTPLITASNIMSLAKVAMCSVPLFHGGIFHTVKDKHKDFWGASRGRQKQLNVWSLTQKNNKTGQATHHARLWANVSLWNPLSEKDHRYKTSSKSSYAIEMEGETETLRLVFGTKWAWKRQSYDIERYSTSKLVFLVGELLFLSPDQWPQWDVQELC